MAFGCPRCGTVSQNPNDEREGYCVRCHDFTGNERIRYGHLPLLDVFEMRELLALVPDPATPLHTAIAEAILHARSERHSRAIQSLYALSRMLKTMELTTMPGTPQLNGLTIFERALEAIERFVRDHGVVEADRRPDYDQVIDVPPAPPPWLMEMLRAPTPMALVDLLGPDEPQ